MKSIATVTIAVWLTALALALPAGALTTPRTTQSTSAVLYLRHGISTLRQRTWHYQDLAGIHRTQTRYMERRTTSTPFLSWIRKLWHSRMARARYLAHRHHLVLAPAGFPPHHALWMCIHNAPEGAWNDTSSPYFGGLQMHANWYGLANAGMVSQSVQEWTAERAWKADGYSQSFLDGQWFKWDGAYYCAKYA